MERGEGRKARAKMDIESPHPKSRLWIQDIFFRVSLLGSEVKLLIKHIAYKNEVREEQN